MAIRAQPGEFDGARVVAYGVGPFEVRTVTVTDVGQEVGSHTHDNNHLTLVLAGTYLRRSRGVVETLRPPFLVFDPAGITHDDCFSASTGAFITLSVDDSCALDLPDEPRKFEHPKALKAALTLARQAKCGLQERIDLEGAAWELLGNIADGSPRARVPRWASDAYDAVMDRSSDHQLSVAAIATEIGVHPVHLARVFRQLWGCAPGDLLRFRRRERAAELLATTDLSAAEIAASVGYADQSHMNRAFNYAYGMPPAAWRRRTNVSRIQDGSFEDP